METPNQSQSSGEESAMLRAVLGAAVDAIITIDERGVIQRVNAAVKAMFGYEQSELVGKNVSLLMPSPERERHDEYLQNFLKTGVRHIIGIGREVIAVNKAGEEFPIDLSVTEVVFGQRRLFTGIIRDMSDRNRTRKALLRERDLNDSLLETAHAIVVLLGVQGDIQRINPFLEELSGYTNQEVFGKDWFELMIAAEERKSLRDIFQRMLVGMPVHGYVNAILTRQKESRLITWSGKRLMDQDGCTIGVLAVGTDITELNRTQQQLIQSERLAAIGQMVTGLAHESRNALQRAQASLEVLSLDVEDQPKLNNLIERAQRAMSELQLLYEEVRNYAAPLKLEMEEVDLVELVKTTWDDLADQWQPRHLQLMIQQVKGGTTVTADRMRIQQVLRNIMENAIAVAEENSDLEVDVLYQRSGSRQTCTVHISDHGPGLDEQQLLKLFDPFFTTKTKGTGLGMAIAHRIITAHRGTITASNTAHGARISFTI